jgi:uncharacterized protein
MSSPILGGVTALDRPWHRPGAAGYALRRLAGILRPPVSVYEPGDGSLTVLRDRPVAVRDGTTLRVNVVLPGTGEGRFPVLMSAHPYGKDNLPRRRGRGWSVSVQLRILRQTAPLRFSSLTGWEAPDPVWWASRGYAVVNCDLRGAGTSEGEASLLSDQEGQDVHDLVTWAAAQPWSTGSVGMLGVSYLAISQWEAAAQQPPGLKAICPWEGFTDAYRDLAFPGGIGAGSRSPAPTGSCTPIAVASGPRSTPPRPVRPSWRSSTATCAAATSRRRRGSVSRSARAATSSPACARRKAGRCRAPAGGRCT